MANKEFLKKFSNDIDLILGALYGEVQLDEEYPTLFNKLCLYYQGKGIQFLDDQEDNYEILIKQLDRDIPEENDD